MKPGGKLILRDHHCLSEGQETLVALAHDVFNLGTGETWETNEKELRHFYDLPFIQNFLEARGFRFEGQRFYQQGDPTLNALMLFTKT
jgi:hypothetical protein